MKRDCPRPIKDDQEAVPLFLLKKSFISLQNRDGQIHGGKAGGFRVNRHNAGGPGRAKKSQGPAVKSVPDGRTVRSMVSEVSAVQPDQRSVGHGNRNREI